MKYPNIRRLQPSTLEKYGLTPDDWEAMLDDQGGVCGVCGEEPKSGRLVTDHEHVVRFWKMPPSQRKKYVRGLVCVVDNHFVVTRYGTPRKFRGAAAYLERYEKRKRTWRHS